ncbi:MAG: hypothetical protein ACUZ8E_18015 [Candidatus Anammoxibacter sp.]
MAKLTIEIRKNRKKQWFIRIRSRNGKIICHTDAYTCRRSALDTAKLLKHEMGWADVLVQNAEGKLEVCDEF